MSAINNLPSSSLWSLFFLKEGPAVFNSPSKAYSFYCDRVICLLSQEVITHEVWPFIEGLLTAERLEKKRKNHLVFHAYYELSEIWGDGNVEGPLGHWIEYEERNFLDEDFFSEQDEVLINWDIPSRETYAVAFHRGLEHLKRGDCYQYNLTFPFDGVIEEGNEISFLKKLWREREKRGEFASFSKINDLYLYSNSPECLFELSCETYCEEYPFVLRTRPIKGTIQRSGDDDEDWRTLSNCKKNESELFMITDLLRNDLNGIERSCVEVEEKKAFLKVPELIHSFSLLKVSLSGEVDLKSIFLSLFPGGSITGAPKKRVKEIISELEGHPRGFYCGSTVLRSEKTFSASINIRSGVIDHNRITYHAGGGITFDSQLENEYEEMLCKHLSLINCLSK